MDIGLNSWEPAYYLSDEMNKAQKVNSIPSVLFILVHRLPANILAFPSPVALWLCFEVSLVGQTAHISREHPS